MQIFNLMQQKLERELVNSKAETKFKKKLIKKESDSCIIANTTSVATASIFDFAIPQKRIMIEKDNIIDKVPIKVKNIILYVASLFQKEIIRIFQNRF